MRGEPSVRSRLVVLVLSVLVPTAIIATSGALYTWQAGRQATERELGSEAQALAADVARELDIAKGVLLALATSPSLVTGDLEGFHGQMARALRPHGARISLIDASGQRRATVPGAYGTALAERGDLGTVKRVFATDRPQVSDLYVGSMTREHLVTVDVPAEVDGQVAYDLTMSFSPAVLGQVLERQRLPAEQLASVVDGKGVILARSDGMDAFVGRRAADVPANTPEGGEGVLTATSQEGYPVLAASARVPGTGWSVVVAARQDVIEAALLRSLTVTAIGGAGVLALGLLVAAHHARRIARPLGSLAAAAEALGKGASPAPTLPGVREASRAGAALARAAIALREREQERDAAEAARRHGEARLARLLATTPAGIVELDAEGRVTYANATAERMLGASAGELVGRSYDDPAWQFAAQDGAPIPPERLPSAWALRGEMVMDYEHALTALDGRRVVLVVDIVPVHDGEGRVEGALAAFQDVTARHTQAQALRESEAALRRMNETLEARVTDRTAALTQAVDALHVEAMEREQAEAQLRQSQKMEAVGQLTGGIAHDFNNMLQGIGSALEMMQRRAEQGRAEEAARYVEAAHKTVERAAALTHRLLAFARQQALEPCAVEPRALIEGMEDLVRRTVGPAITIELRMGEGIWTVLCDPNQLENVLLNLAINARDALPEGGRLTMGTQDVRLEEADVTGQEGTRPGDYVEISVADTGTGMDEATRARAFEPFFTTKPLGQGTGLGLSQLYGFVRQSGGVVHLDSAPGRGTTVRLYLPRYEPVWAHEEQPVPRTELEGAGAGEAVLLVDDEEGVRAVAAEHLRDLGYAVLEAGDGPAALRLLRSGTRVDMLVTDVGLPGGLNGRQVADAARERRSDLPVLFITGYAGSLLDGPLAAGMEVLGKPFTLNALTARIRAMLETVPAK